MLRRQSGISVHGSTCILHDMLLIFIVVLQEFIFSILTADRTPNEHAYVDAQTAAHKKDQGQDLNPADYPHEAAALTNKPSSADQMLPVPLQLPAAGSPPFSDHLDGRGMSSSDSG